MLDSLVQSQAYSKQLAFMGDFRAYLRYLAEGERDQAAVMLAALTIARIAPRGFWGVMLSESLPLLEGECLSSGSTQTHISALSRLIPSSSRSVY